MPQNWIPEPKSDNPTCLAIESHHFMFHLSYKYKEITLACSKTTITSIIVNFKDNSNAISFIWVRHRDHPRSQVYTCKQQYIPTTSSFMFHISCSKQLHTQQNSIELNQIWTYSGWPNLLWIPHWILLTLSTYINDKCLAGLATNK